MAKIALLGDAHMGARNSNKNVEQWQRKFYEQCFWPELEKRGIKTVIQTGDYFDNRKWINLQTLAFQKEVFCKRAADLDISVLGIVGNHDIPLRHSLEMSSPVQLLSDETHVEFFDEIKEFEIDGRKITLMPWICRENFEESQARIREGGDIIVGHFEISGFVMHPGAVSKEGINMSDFSGWNQVISGHYHSQSEKGNIKYIGTPYQMTWSDASTKHGFWILDTDDSSMEFVENPFRYFHRLIWEDGCQVDYENIKSSYVKVNVKKKTDFESFEKFVDSVNLREPFELKIIESFEEYNSENVQDLIKVQTTTQLIEEYINDVATDLNKESIVNAMLSIYDEAMEMEE